MKANLMKEECRCRPRKARHVRLGVEALESRLTPSAFWNANLNTIGLQAGTLNVQELAGNGVNNQIQICEQSGVIHVVGNETTSVNGVQDYCVLAKDVKSIVVSQKAQVGCNYVQNNDIVRIDLKDLCLPSDNVSVCLGTGTIGCTGHNTVTSCNDTLNGLTVTNLATTKSQEFDSKCDTVQGLTVTQSNGSDTVCISGLKQNALIKVDQGNGNCDSMDIMFSDLGQATLTQGKGKNDEMTLCAVKGTSLTATQGNGCDDEMSVKDSCFSGNLVLKQGDGYQDEMALCNIYAGKTVKLCQGDGFADDLSVNGLHGACLVNISQGDGGDSASLENIYCVGELDYKAGLGLNSLETECIHVDSGVLDLGGFGIWASNGDVCGVYVTGYVAITVT